MDVDMAARCRRQGCLPCRIHMITVFTCCATAASTCSAATTLPMSWWCNRSRKVNPIGLRSLMKMYVKVLFHFYFKDYLCVMVPLWAEPSCHDHDKPPSHSCQHKHSASSGGPVGFGHLTNQPCLPHVPPDTPLNLVSLATGLVLVSRILVMTPPRAHDACRPQSL